MVPAGPGAAVGEGERGRQRVHHGHRLEQPLGVGVQRSPLVALGPRQQAADGLGLALGARMARVWAWSSSTPSTTQRLASSWSRLGAVVVRNSATGPCTR